jgi:hypothetical protein
MNGPNSSCLLLDSNSKLFVPRIARMRLTLRRGMPADQAIENAIDIDQDGPIDFANPSADAGPIDIVQSIDKGDRRFLQSVLGSWRDLHHWMAVKFRRDRSEWDDEDRCRLVEKRLVVVQDEDQIARIVIAGDERFDFVDGAGFHELSQLYDSAPEQTIERRQNEVESRLFQLTDLSVDARAVNRTNLKDQGNRRRCETVCG